MKKITKKEFLVDVAIEVELLKLHTTEKEKSLLRIEDFNPEEKKQCIYGMLTDSCESFRAKVLMDLCCKRVMDFDNRLSNIKQGISFSNKNFIINGQYKGETWLYTGQERYSRNYRYMSALEGYIFLKGAKVSNIIDYIKGNKDKLVLVHAKTLVIKLEELIARENAWVQQEQVIDIINNLGEEEISFETQTKLLNKIKEL